MEINNIEGRSRGSSFRRRALTLVGVSALTLSGAGAAIFGASQAFATTPTVTATSSSFTIGSGAVGNLSVSSTNDTLKKTGIYTIDFTATDGIAANGSVSLTFSDAQTSAVTGTLTDTTTGASQPIAVASNTTETSQTIAVANKVASGDSVQIVIGGVTQGSSTDISNNVAVTDANVVVSTSSDTAPVTSSNYTLAAATAAAKPTASASPSSAGSVATWTLGSFGVTDTTTTGTTTLASGSTLKLTLEGATTGPYAGMPTLPLSDYTITDTPSSGSASTQTPTSVTAVSSGVVNIVTSAALTVGDTITLSVANVTNPSATTVTPAISITPASGSDAWSIVDPGTTTTDTFPSVTISGSQTSVTSPSISASPNDASTSTSTNNSTYSLGFTATTALSTTGTVTVQLAPGSVIPSASSTNPVIITDETSGATASITSDTPGPSTSPTSTTNNKVTVTTGISIAKSDVVKVQVFGVANPTTTGSLTGEISTSGDAVVTSASYTLVTPTTTIASVSVATSSTLAGGSATYTITNLEASSAIAAGSTISIGTSASSSIQFPTVAGDYQITDLTTSSGTAVAAGESSDSGFNGVDITTTNAIAANDVLQITIVGVINPSTGGSYKLQFAPLVASTVAVSAAATAPNAASTMASGSLVQTGGTIYVIAGGVAFGIPTFSDYQTISAGLGNPMVVQSSTAPSTTGTIASGTLVQTVGSPQINVVGSNNTYYGFSSVSQFESDGYSFANVIQVPSLTGLIAGSGSAPNAASTMASGSLVQTGGTIYVIAGGVAFGIPTFSDYQTISAGLGNPMVVQSSTAPSTTGTIASGTLVQTVGSPQINVVNSSGTQVGFSTASEFTSDGYSFAKVIMIP